MTFIIQIYTYILHPLAMWIYIFVKCLYLPFYFTNFSCVWLIYAAFYFYELFVVGRLYDYVKILHFSDAECIYHFSLSVSVSLVVSFYSYIRNFFLSVNTIRMRSLMQMNHFVYIYICISYYIVSLQFIIFHV